MKNENLFNQLYETSINEIKAIKDLSVLHKMNNEQSFINWLDELNKLSIDPPC